MKEKKRMAHKRVFFALLVMVAGIVLPVASARADDGKAELAVSCGVKAEANMSGLIRTGSEKVETGMRPGLSLGGFLNLQVSSHFSVQADFYMAESLKNTGNPEAACEHFLKVMKNGTGSFTEIAALNYANISYGLENYENALGAYEFLRDMARLDNNRNDAKAGIARSKYRLKDYAGAVAEAESILSQAWAPEGLKTEMEYIAAKSLYADGKRDEAKKIFETLSEDPLSAEGAESAYLLILDAFESGDFESVESMTFSLAESRTGQRYWLAKSFIVLGDSYAERGEWKQAEATFRSILDGYERSSDNDDVTENVKIRLDAIAKHYSDKYSTVLKTQD